jgi:hypothetical protein
MRRFFLAVIAAAAVALFVQPVLAESYTTRIEPRAYYGATVTVEHGVRVYRPLPVQRQVIINPGGQTPLALGFNDTRVVEQSTSHNYFYDDGDGVPAIAQGGVFLGSSGRGFAHRGHHRGGRGRVNGIGNPR